MEDDKTKELSKPSAIIILVIIFIIIIAGGVYIIQHR